MSDSSADLPLWRCHKLVRAAKIVAMDPVAWHLDLDCGGRVELDGSYFSRHNPLVGGYYVRYEDGYESYSPPMAFENGYTLLEDE